jgi:transcriptional regulator with XRE-family HTH domain
MTAKTYRENIGLSRAQVAKRLGFAETTIARYERGDGKSLGVARKIARLYGCSVFVLTRQAQIKR